MTKQGQEKFFDEFTQKMKEVMIGKSDDYALSKDRLSVFKNVGMICGSGEDGRTTCLHLIATKVARLSSLIGEGKKPSNESIDDSILDLANYTILLGMLQKEHANFEAIIAAPIEKLHPTGKSETPQTKTIYRIKTFEELTNTKGVIKKKAGFFCGKSKIAFAYIMENLCGQIIEVENPKKAFRSKREDFPYISSDDQRDYDWTISPWMLKKEEIPI